MGNAVIQRLADERQRSSEFVDQLLARVDADGRDLVETELSTLAATRQRIGEIDSQLTELRQIDDLVTAHEHAAIQVHPSQRRAPLAGPSSGPVYATAGAFVVDYMAARGMLTNERNQRLPVDPQAAERVRYALENQTTAETPGLLPHPIIGGIVSLIDASRPFITGIGGGRPMGGIPGKTFGRPTVTQHVLVGPQSAEKAELPSRKMIIGEIAFTKQTFGGAVDVSRQDIDWTSPAAWDILVRDLADVYAQETENAAADGMYAASDDVNAATPVAANTLEGWSEALYTAAGLIYSQAKRLPDRLFVSTDVWGMLGPVVDLQLASMHRAGSSELSSFSGDVMGIPRIVVPSLPPASAVLAVAGAYEVYEEVIGLLTAVEPSLLGVEVAYGGYIAHNAVIPAGLARLTPPAPTGGLRASQSKSSDTKS